MPTRPKSYSFDRCPYGQAGCAPKSCPDCAREWQEHALAIKSPEAAQSLQEHRRRNEESVELSRLFLELARRLRPADQERLNQRLRDLIQRGTRRLDRTPG